jgi:hypothetical protein
MKEVTRERIEKAIQHIEETRTSRTEWLIDITRYFAQIGMKTVLAEQTDTLPNYGMLREKLGLELDYHGIPKREEDCRKILDELWRLTDHYHRKIHKVYRIQEKAGVSGLNQKVIELAEQIVTVYEDFEDDLPLIKQDLPVLRRAKPTVVSLFLDHAKYHNLKLWLLYDEGTMRDHWEEVSFNRIYELMPLYDWALVSDFRELHGDETERWLRLGKGTDTTTNKSGIQFAVKSAMPSL